MTLSISPRYMSNASSTGANDFSCSFAAWSSVKLINVDNFTQIIDNQMQLRTKKQTVLFLPR